MAKVELKQPIVQAIADDVNGAAGVVIVDYRGLTVEEDTQLRRNLREANVNYFVVKNTLLRLAAKETGLDALDSILHGPTAIAVSTEDPVAPAKVFSIPSTLFCILTVSLIPFPAKIS